MSTIIYRMINNKVLLCSTGNYIQYPVINHNGKEYEKKSMYLYNCITLLWAELTQLCNQLYKIKQIHIPTPIPPETDMPFSSVKSLSHVQLFATPWNGACQASLFITSSQSLPKLMPIESVRPSNYLILCRPFLLLSSIFTSIRVFSNESTLHMWLPKYWNFSFSISPSNEHQGLISFRMDWLDLLSVQGILKSLLQHHSSKA